jgi:hypothetical protein
MLVAELAAGLKAAGARGIVADELLVGFDPPRV